MSAGSATSSRRCVGELVEPGRRPAEEPRDGFVARARQQAEERVQLVVGEVARRAVGLFELGGDQLAHDVVARMLAPLVDVRLPVVADRCG